MNKKSKITTANILFFVVVVLQIYGLFFSEILTFLSKPFLTISLVIVYLVAVSKPNFWFVSAMFFSFWGDVLLLFKSQFFTFGLGSFLIAHLIYIKLISKELKKVSLQKIIVSSLPFIVFLVIFLFVILDKVIDVKAPIIIYGIVISAFGTLSFLNHLQNKNTVSLWLFLGALFFIVSDSLIAINKFYYTQEDYEIFIMVTYILAQYLICKSFIAKAYHQ